jgi:hypothetical protein
MTDILIQRELHFWIDAALDEQDQAPSSKRFAAPELLRHLEGLGVVIRSRSGRSIIWTLAPTMKRREHELVDICLRIFTEHAVSA